MGVRVRLSRNASMYVPFWIAAPVYLFVGAAWLVIIIGWALVLLVVALGKLAVYGVTSGTAAIGRIRSKEG